MRFDLSGCYQIVYGSWLEVKICHCITFCSILANFRLQFRLHMGRNGHMSTSDPIFAPIFEILWVVSYLTMHFGGACVQLCALFCAKTGLVVHNYEIWGLIWEWGRSAMAQYTEMFVTCYAISVPNLVLISQKCTSEYLTLTASGSARIFRLPGHNHRTKI